MDLLKTKQVLYQKCQDHLDDRLAIVNSKIEDIQIALQSETKSSAGDKHETGRAMIQLEREKLGFQLAEIQKQRAILSKINYKNKTDIIGLGTLVITSKANYFIAISAGELRFNNRKFYAISKQTPIGALLSGARKGSILKFRTEEFEITHVF